MGMGANEYNSPPLGMKEITPVSGGRFLIRWNCLQNDTYTVWSSSDPSTPQWNKEESVPFQGETTLWMDEAASGSVKFYRIEVW